jgi:isoamylase
MNPADWGDGNARCIGMFMSGFGIVDVGPRGEALKDDDFFLLFNAHHEHVDFTLPVDGGAPWQVELDTTDAGDAARPQPESLEFSFAGPAYPVHCRSLVLLRRPAHRA